MSELSFLKPEHALLHLFLEHLPGVFVVHDLSHSGGHQPVVVELLGFTLVGVLILVAHHLLLTCECGVV